MGSCGAAISLVRWLKRNNTGGCVKKLLIWFSIAGLLSAAARGAVTTRKLDAHVTLYEKPSSGSALPSFWQNFFSEFRLPGSSAAALPFGRSVALLVGIGHYKYITPSLDYVPNDIEKMRNYLLGEGGFDAVYVMDESVSPQSVDRYMMSVLPSALTANDRLLFYYSGHGGDPGGAPRPG